jgi:8-oxo-dGTP diphosphatase
MAIFLVRHADAGNRGAWHAEDRLRPLTQQGLQQAVDVAELLAARRPSRLLSSPHVRCVQTLEPLAATLGVAIEENVNLAEGNAKLAGDLLRTFIGTGGAEAVLSTHGDVVTGLLSVLTTEYRVDLGPAPRYEKGSVWEIRAEHGRPVVASYLSPTIETSR